ncbi:hypothetical protein VTK73DRAFT_7305 [Phialemonium thermophilum]|uniref:Uncharacterized protein n=1 Tax=Phialemonium thermophilum TaxID=223376 RepID=A0ABR3WFU4_9PEZI
MTNEMFLSHITGPAEPPAGRTDLAFWSPSTPSFIIRSCIRCTSVVGITPPCSPFRCHCYNAQKDLASPVSHSCRSLFLSSCSSGLVVIVFVSLSVQTTHEATTKQSSHTLLTRQGTNKALQVSCRFLSVSRQILGQLGCQIMQLPRPSSRDILSCNCITCFPRRERRRKESELLLFIAGPISSIHYLCPCPHLSYRDRLFSIISACLQATSYLQRASAPASSSSLTLLLLGTIGPERDLDPLARCRNVKSSLAPPGLHCWLSILALSRLISPY